MSKSKNRIREIRLSKKVSGTKIAKELGISPQYYYDIEKGERNLSAELALKIAGILDVSVDFLLNDDSSQDKNEINKYHYDERELNAIILERLKILTDDEGHFFEDVQADIFNTLDDTLYIAHAFHDISMYRSYMIEFNSFFNGPYEEYDDTHRLETLEEFNSVINFRTIKSVLDNNNYDDKYKFLESLNKIINKHEIKYKNSFSNEKEFLKKLELSDKSILEQYDLELDGKKLTEEEAKGVIAYLRSLRSIDQ